MQSESKSEGVCRLARFQDLMIRPPVALAAEDAAAILADQGALAFLYRLKHALSHGRCRIPRRKAVRVPCQAERQ